MRTFGPQVGIASSSATHWSSLAGSGARGYGLGLRHTHQKDANSNMLNSVCERSVLTPRNCTITLPSVDYCSTAVHEHNNTSAHAGWDIQRILVCISRYFEYF